MKRANRPPIVDPRMGRNPLPDVNSMSDFEYEQLLGELGMKRANYTPGPWRTGDGTENNLKTDVFVGGRCLDAGTEANARLIAACPELVAVVEHAIKECMRAYKVTTKLETRDVEGGAYLNELVMRLNEELKTALKKATGGDHE